MSAFDFNPFDFLGSAGASRQQAEPPTTPMPEIRGKEIDGVLYVRAADVAAALEVLSPKINKRLIDKLRGYGR